MRLSSAAGSFSHVRADIRPSLEQRAQSSVRIRVERRPQRPAEGIPSGRAGRGRTGRRRRATHLGRAVYARPRRHPSDPRPPAPAARGRGAGGSRRRCGSGPRQLRRPTRPRPRRLRRPRLRRPGLRRSGAASASSSASPISSASTSITVVARSSAVGGSEAVVGSTVTSCHSPAETASPPSAGCHTCSPVSGSTTHSPWAHSSLW